MTDRHVSHPHHISDPIVMQQRVLCPACGHSGGLPRVHLPSLPAMVCDGLHASSPAPRKSLRRLASTRGFKPLQHGWIRVFEGLEPFAVDAPSKLLKVTLNSTVENINKQLGYGEELTLWMQIGGEKSRRLEGDEYPLRIQEQFLVAHGWSCEARRLRLAVDPELRFCLRWCAGPAARAGGERSGTVYVLKGHVFPQWKPRPAYIVGSRLHMCGTTSETLELCSGIIDLCQPKAQKFMLCLKPRCHGSGVSGDAVVSHLFLGFNSIWERNMWLCWLREVEISGSSIVCFLLNDSIFIDTGSEWSYYNNLLQVNSLSGP